MEPLPWLPVATGSIPAHTKAALPLEEPPGDLDRSYGLRVSGGSPEPNSGKVVLPTKIAPDHLSA